MNWNEYQAWVMTKAGPNDGTIIDALVLSALGLTGESGEFADTVKKIAYHGYQLSSDGRMKMALELGDVLWYVARAAEALMLPLSDIAQLNVRKLNARYPNGFASTDALNKKSDEAVVAAMNEKDSGTDIAKGDGA